MAPFRYTPLQLDDEKVTSSEPGLSITATSHRRHGVRRALVAAATVLIVAALGALVGVKIYQSKLSKSLLEPQLIFPKFSTMTRTFEDPRPDLFTQPVNDWDDILPQGGGFINVHNARLYDLPRSIPSDPNFAEAGSEIFGMAIWHQLHCVRDLRAALLFHRDGIIPTHQMISDDHADHCFDYLRQTIMCHGDTTIEWGRFVTAEGDTKGSVDGYNIPHKCRDYDAIRRWTIENRSANDTYGDEHPEGH